MTTDLKLILGIGIVTIGIIVGGVFLTSNSSQNSENQPVADSKLLIKKDSHQTASGTAKVAIVEFGDYQCPACKIVYPTTKQIFKNYSSKINFVFRNFPLSQHSNAQIAAEAAEAAAAQGKFWEMHDKLYENQNKWADSNSPLDIFTSYAKDLRLNIEKFKNDIIGNKYAERINQDENDGNSLGVNSTPTFFVNGEMLSGSPSYEVFKQKIDFALNH